MPWWSSSRSEGCVLQRRCQPTPAPPAAQGGLSWRGGGAAKPTWKGFVNSRRRRCRATVLAVEGGGRRCVHTILEHSSKTQLIAPSTARAQMKCIRTSEDRRLLFIATCQGWRDRKVMRQTEHHLFTIYSSTTKSVGEGARGGGGDACEQRERTTDCNNSHRDTTTVSFFCDVCLTDVVRHT